MASKTIHHIINDYNLTCGGAQLLVQQIHQECLKNDINSKLLGISNKPKSNPISSFSFNTKSPYSFKSFYKLALYFKNNIRNGDVIHAHLFPTIFYISILKLIFSKINCKYVLTLHNTKDRRRTKWWGKLIDNFTFSNYDNLIAISKGVYNEYMFWTPKFKDKISVIYNGTKLNFKKIKKREKKDFITIISIGRLHKQKNYSYAIDVIEKLEERNIIYKIAGDGKLKKTLTNKANNLLLKNKISFLGYVDDVKPLLLEADIFFMPSLYEGFGIAALEAMNAGLPCVLSDVDGLNELIVKNNEEGFLVPNNQTNQLIKILSDLINDYEKRCFVGENAFKRSKSFDLKNTFYNYKKIYLSHD